MKKIEIWIPSVVKILFWVKHQGHQPNLNSPPVSPWPLHFQVIIVSPSFLHRKLKVHKNYYLCQKLPVFYLMHIDDTIKMCKACEEWNTETASRISTENWYQEFAAFSFNFTIMLPNYFLFYRKIPQQKVRSPLPPQRQQKVNDHRHLEPNFKCHQTQTSALQVLSAKSMFCLCQNICSLINHSFLFCS